MLWLVWSEAVDFYMNRCGFFQAIENSSRSVFLLLCPYSKLSLCISKRAVGPGCQLNTMLPEEKVQESSIGNWA